MWQGFLKNRITRTLSSLKLAVFVILSLVVLCIWGTLTESSYNTEFARRLVYTSPWFIGILLLLFLNILFAALVRLPFKKKLSGFYIIHLGLLTLLTGAAVTAVFGIDGQIRLMPQEPANAVIIDEPQFYGFYAPHKTTMSPLEFVHPLPKATQVYTRKDKVFTEILDYDVFVEKFIPFASAKFSFKPHDDPHKKTRLMTVELKNANISQEIELGNLEHTQITQTLGPLTLTLMPTVPANCFAKFIADLNFKYLMVTPERCEGLHVLSQEHIHSHAQSNDQAQTALISLEKHRESPQVIYFAGNKLGFGKGIEWQLTTFEPNQDIALPWMGFTVTVTRLIDNKDKLITWDYDPPRGSEAERHAAALIRVQHRYNREDVQSLWIDDTGIKEVQTKSGRVLQFMLGNKLKELPFSLELKKFKMETNPGTEEAASYESFVTVREEGQDTEEAHIYMNSPLKKERFTFYQASYFPLEGGEFGSVLSVNHDPGRMLKYFGSGFLVMGSVIHFILKSRRRKE